MWVRGGMVPRDRRFAIPNERTAVRAHAPESGCPRARAGAPAGEPESRRHGGGGAGGRSSAHRDDLSRHEATHAEPMLVEPAAGFLRRAVADDPVILVRPFVVSRVDRRGGHLIPRAVVADQFP